jgi:hypothetical protein
MVVFLIGQHPVQIRADDHIHAFCNVYPQFLRKPACEIGRQPDKVIVMTGLPRSPRSLAMMDR